MWSLVMAMAHGLVLVHRPLRPRFCSPPRHQRGRRTPRQIGAGDGIYFRGPAVQR